MSFPYKSLQGVDVAAMVHENLLTHFSKSHFKAVPPLKCRILAVVIFTVGSSGCALFSKRDKPIDINNTAPSASLLINAVQAAIDKTADNPGWQGSTAFKKNAQKCQDNNATANTAHDKTCETRVAQARSACKGFTGLTAAALCADYLQSANAFCADTPPKDDACKVAESLAPITIKSATLKFAAAISQEGSLGGELKLLSAKQSRKYGRKSSFDITLVPDPSNKIQALDGQFLATDLSNLTALLVAALNAGAPCTQEAASAAAINGDEPKFSCSLSAAPHLILQNASIGFDISYTQSSSAGVKWSVAPLKISNGQAGLSSNNDYGNTLTLELIRAP